MSCFSDKIKFKYPWRKYQQRVLDELDLHTNDEHLHVIAPPGSGKTVLGLEVMLRLGKPTLILAPTISIRNQWIQRFCDLFLQQLIVPDWISKDIRNPKLITVVTYQGLHSACNDSEANKLDFEHETDLKIRVKSNFLNLKKIVQQLEKIGISTFVLDESHHLKNEWWQTLSRLKKELKPKIVGLTATPPYDVTPLEWHRYIELNGPVDVEISVPELIAEGDLCPHQDFVYFTTVTEDERQKISKLRHRVRELYVDMKSNLKLIEMIEQHPIIVNPLNSESYIFDNIDFYSACLIFLKENNVSISPVHLEIFGLIELNEISKKGKDVNLHWELIQLPPLDESWMEILLSYVLFADDKYFIQRFEIEHKELLERLKYAGVVDRKTIRFLHNSTIDKKISSSITKLHAIQEIVKMEYDQLKENLRQVVLSDYVRKEYLINETSNDILLKHLGVVPIFETLRRDNKQGIKLGILTGTLVIIPKEAYDHLLKFAIASNIKEVKFFPVSYDKNYMSCNVDDQSRDYMVHLITSLFQQGHIEVLIGTKALLGEGWDAPSINSLILASVVGTFVSSNQMRGRAIRTTDLEPNKVSNIWHIVCIDPSAKDGGVDVNLMERRFRNFVGISEEDVRIQNGISRLNLYSGHPDFDNAGFYNQQTIDRAGKRSTLKGRWEEALPNGSELVEEIKIPFFEPQSFQKFKAVQVQKTVLNMIATLTSSILFFIETSMGVFDSLGRLLGVNIQTALLILFGIGTLFYGRRTFKAYMFFLKYRDISKDIYQIGNALVNTLCKNKIFTTPVDALKVLTFADKDGYVYCHLENGTTYEKSVFVQMLQEIVNPIYNPRYVIVRKSKLLKMFQQLDFHAVPEVLAKKAALAKDLLHFWELHVGNAQLIFTKSSEGKRFLIHSRLNALSSLNVNKTKEIEHINTWR